MLWKFWRALTLLVILAALASLAASLTACPISTAGLADAWLSVDESGERRRNVFTTDSTNIACIADVKAGRKDLTVEMLIRQVQILNPQNKAAITTNIISVYVDSAGGGTKTLTLKPAKKDGGAETNTQPFPAGRFQCEIYFDGILEASLPFNIDFAPCPAAAIETGAICGGYYELNRGCPRAGAGIPNSGPPAPGPPNCTCEGSPGSKWVCP